METRGVASVRSPVCNLRQHHANVTHDEFVDAVVKAFRTEYDVHEEVSEAFSTLHRLLTNTSQLGADGEV